MDSPLGRMMVALLDKMEEQKQRHPLREDSSVEYKYYHKIMEACQDIWSRAHSAIEYNFCSGGEPGALGVLGIIKDGSLLYYRYKDLVQNRVDVFCKELEVQLENVIKTAVSMQGDISTNVVKILEDNTNTYFAKTLEIPGVDLSVYFLEIKKRISNLPQNRVPVPIEIQQMLELLKTDFSAVDKGIPDLINFQEILKLPYELIELVLIHYNTFPRELDQLLSFFNPKSLTVDLHNGYVVGPSLRALIGRSFKLGHVDQSKDSKSKFRYQFKGYTPKEVIVESVDQDDNPTKAENNEDDTARYDVHTEELDVEPHFEEHFELPLAGILAVMVGYYHLCILNQNVQILLDKDVLCQSLLRECTRQVQGILPVIDFDQNYLTKVKRLKGLEQILEIDRTLTALEEFTAGFQKLEKMRELPSQFFRSVYRAVTKEPIHDKELVPAKLLKRIDGVGIPYIIPLFDHCMVDVKQRLEENKSKYDDFLGLKSSLERVLNGAVSQYKRAKRQNCPQELQGYMQECKLAQEKFEFAIKSITVEIGAVSKDFQSLELDLGQVTQEHGSILALLELAENLLTRAKKSSEVDPSFKKFDKDNQLQNDLSRTSEEVLGFLEIFNNAVAGILFRINEKKKIIEKAYSEAKFLEKMRSSNPEQMRQIVLERRGEITRLGCVVAEFERQLSDTRNYNGLVREVIGNVSKHKKIEDDEVDRLLNDKDFVLQWIEEQKGFLNTLFTKISDNKSFPDYYVDLINKLGFVKRYLQVSKEFIKFKEIDNLPCFKSDDDQAPCGFDKFLSIINMADGSIEKLKDYRDRQEKIYRFNPSEKELNETRSFLFAMACKKIDELQKVIADGDHIKTAVPRLSEIKDLINDIDLKGNEKSLQDRIDEVSLDKDKMEDSVPILEQCVDIQISIKHFFAKIEEFNNEGDFINNWSLYRKCPKLDEEQDRLEELAREFGAVIQRSKFPQDNEQYMSVVLSLLGATRIRISDIIRYKFESTLRDYETKLNDLEEKFGPIHAELTELSIPLDLKENETPESGYKKTVDHHMSLDRISKINNLLERHDLLLKSITQTRSELEQTEEDTAHLKGDYNEQIKQKKSALLSFKANLEPVGKGLALAKRISLSATLFNSLDQYIVKRSERYYVKDIFYDGDKIERSIFINNLKVGLNKFNASGDSSHVINFISQNMSRFPGTHFRAVMSRTICTLMDYDDQWDAIGNKKISSYDVFPDENARRREIKGILQNLLSSRTDSHRTYARKVNYIYGRIQEMKEYSETLSPKYSTNVGNLAKRLQKTVDQFVLSHPENDPDQAKVFEKFQIRLTAVLHSRDNVLCDLGYSFGRFVLNIIVALASLCIQPICYKITTGHFGFFAKNYVEESLNRVTRTMDELKPISLSVSA